MRPGETFQLLLVECRENKTTPISIKPAKKYLKQQQYLPLCETSVPYLQGGNLDGVDILAGYSFSAVAVAGDHHHELARVTCLMKVLAIHEIVRLPQEEHIAPIILEHLVHPAVHHGCDLAFLVVLDAIDQHNHVGQVQCLHIVNIPWAACCG